MILFEMSIEESASGKIYIHQFSQIEVDMPETEKELLIYEKIREFIFTIEEQEHDTG